MPIIKASELREMSDEQLHLTLKETCDSYFKLNIQAQTERLGAPSELTKKRRLIARIEKRFGKNLPVAVLFQSPTIQQLSEILREDDSPDSWSCLITVQPKGSKIPFFWIHGDWSNAVLPAHLGQDQPLYGLEHQAGDGRPALYTQVQAIANHYLDELRTVRSRGPYLLGGYSFGAVLAYEIAHQLKREGEEVSLLFMLDPPGVMTGACFEGATRGEPSAPARPA